MWMIAVNTYGGLQTYLLLLWQLYFALKWLECDWPGASGVLWNPSSFRVQRLFPAPATGLKWEWQKLQGEFIPRRQDSSHGDLDLRTLVLPELSPAALHSRMPGTTLPSPSLSFGIRLLPSQLLSPTFSALSSLFLTMVFNILEYLILD